MINKFFGGIRSTSVALVSAPSRLGSGGRKLLFGLLGVLLIAGLATAGFAYKLYSEDQHRDRMRSEALAVAVTNVPKLLSYDSASVDKDFSSKYDFLSGKFKQDFMDMSEKTIIPLAKEQKVSTKADVAASGIISSDDSRVDALLFVNQSTTRGSEGDDKALQGSRIKVGLVQADGKWVIDGLTPV